MSFLCSISIFFVLLFVVFIATVACILQPGHRVSIVYTFLGAGLRGSWEVDGVIKTTTTKQKVAGCRCTLDADASGVCEPDRNERLGSLEFARELTQYQVKVVSAVTVMVAVDQLRHSPDL